MDNSRILDDLSRVAGGAFSVLSALKTQIQNNMKDSPAAKFGDKFGASFGSSSSHDDVARLQGVVSKLRIEQETLKSRIAELEAMLGKKAPKAKTAAKPTVKAKPKAATQKTAAPKTKAKTKKRATK